MLPGQQIENSTKISGPIHWWIAAARRGWGGCPELSCRSSASLLSWLNLMRSGEPFGIHVARAHWHHLGLHLQVILFARSPNLFLMRFEAVHPSSYVSEAVMEAQDLDVGAHFFSCTQIGWKFSARRPQRSTTFI